MIGEEKDKEKESSASDSESTGSNSRTRSQSGSINSTPLQANNSLSSQSPALHNDRDSYEKTVWYKCLLAFIMVPLLDLAVWTYWWDVDAWNANFNANGDPTTLAQAYNASGNTASLYEDLVVWIFLGAPFFIFFYALIFVACYSGAQKRWSKWPAPVLLMLSLAAFIVVWSWYSLFGDGSNIWGLLDDGPTAQEIFTGTVAGYTLYVVWGTCVIYVVLCFGIASRHLFGKT